MRLVAGEACQAAGDVSSRAGPARTDALATTIAVRRAGPEPGRQRSVTHALLAADSAMGDPADRLRRHPPGIDEGFVDPPIPVVRGRVVAPGEVGTGRRD